MLPFKIKKGKTDIYVLPFCLCLKLKLIIQMKDSKNSENLAENLSSEKATNYNGALATLVTVFFFWGFIAAGNGVLIPFCKTYFNLDQFQSQLIDFAFYGAYYMGQIKRLDIASRVDAGFPS